MEKMVSFEFAKKLIREKVETLEPELVDVHRGLGRVLAEDAYALVTQPMARVSFRDGYALNSEESGPGKKLKVAGRILAGNPLAENLSPGSAFWVATEAVVPEGADAVVEEERVQRLEDMIELSQAVESGLNLRPEGEEFNQGDLLVRKGVVLDERKIALLLASGHFELSVIRKPRLWVIGVGDELRHPGSVIRAGQGYPSAAWLAAMMAETLGCELSRVLLVADEAEAIVDAIPERESADLVITIGGTGFGRKDIIQEALKSVSARIIFQGVKMRPSHSFIFSLREKQVIFSLPGRISAAEIGFELLARPGILKMQAKPGDDELMIQTRVNSEIGPAGDQCHILRAKMIAKGDDLWVEPLRRRSWHKELVESEGLIVVEEGRGAVKAGDWVGFIAHKNLLPSLVKLKSRG